ncbi:MAG: D-aminoacylase [Haliscomenobacter sp.]|jgi:N-acyl-D-amino-acid deacylase|nr:D-aminoacylase [Haliscomenobacter sp.]
MKVCSASFFAGLFLLLSAALSAQRYDLLIRNGQVFEGSAGATLWKADLAIKGGKILRVAPEIKGKSAREIDARGLVVSPGFIDLHTHLEPLPLDPQAQSHVRQGVTTALGGPDGGGPLGIGSYLDTLSAIGIGLNTAYLIGHNTVRNHVMGLVNRAPTADELRQMEDWIEKAMKEGAFGISTGLKYLPGTYAKLDEIVALSKVAARHGGIYTSHLREEGLGLLEGVAEAIQIAELAGIPVVLTHHKAIGLKMWGSSVKTLAMVDSARTKGLDVMIDQYPYTASFTGISVLIPSWALEGHPVREFARRCEDPILRDSIKQGIIFNLLNDRGGGDLRRIQFGSFDWKPELNGKTLYDWAILQGLEPNVEHGADLVIEAQIHRGAGCIFHAISEEDVRRIMKHPQTMVASDGRLSQPGKDHPHPRAYGTFPRVLGHYVREEKVLTLEEALFKMTGQPALRLGLDKRGFIRKGYYADLTLFDPATVKDKSTFEAPHQYPEGIPYVLVNGKMAIDNGAYQDVRAGKPLRRKD